MRDALERRCWIMLFQLLVNLPMWLTHGDEHIKGHVVAFLEEKGMSELMADLREEPRS